jgi:aminoglycoside phosphotransferase (APT) family kinase protein
MSENQLPPQKLHDDEVIVDDPLVRRLVDTQFPQWSDMTLRRVRSTGTDNAIFRLGSDLGLRLPRIHWAVSQVDLEWNWLPKLESHLPITVPVPLAKGEPGFGYPYPWLVYPWIAGEDLQHASGVDLISAARRVASMIAALHCVDIVGNPPLGKRANSLRPLDQAARWALEQLDRNVFDIKRATAVWEAALHAEPWTKPPVWTHGDLLAANIIVRDNDLAGIIDWSCAGIGDPACDAQLAWFLSFAARAAFREALNFDDATWARARGWVVWQTAMFIPYYAETIPDAVATAKLRLQAVLEEGP